MRSKTTMSDIEEAARWSIPEEVLSLRLGCWPQECNNVSRLIRLHNLVRELDKDEDEDEDVDEGSGDDSV
eukprot:2416867-Pyramimonas_sp.AAC.1